MVGRGRGKVKIENNKVSGKSFTQRLRSGVAQAIGKDQKEV